MDFLKLNGEIKLQTALNEESSLPFIVEVDGTLMVLWFKFKLSEFDNEIQASIHEIFATKDGHNVTDYHVELRQVIPFDENEVETILLSKKDYLCKLGDVYQNFSGIVMEQLLRQAVHEGILLLFNLAKQWYTEHIKNKNKQDNDAMNEQENAEKNEQENSLDNSQNNS